MGWVRKKIAWKPQPACGNPKEILRSKRKEPRSWNAQPDREVKGTNRLGAKESRLETATNVWKLQGNPKVQVKGTNRLGAKESRLETTTNVWKLQGNPKVQVKGTKVMKCASASQRKRNQWAGCVEMPRGNGNQCVET